MEASEASAQPLKGVSCEADTCRYNDGNGYCTAAAITIKNRMALLGEETMCGTFEEPQ